MREARDEVGNVMEHGSGPGRGAVERLGWWGTASAKVAGVCYEKVVTTCLVANDF
jgi:hypothetical protein